MGSQAVQSSLWGQRPADWANVQELTSRPVYLAVLDSLPLAAGPRLLDVGCGSGHFGQLAHERGARVTGLDATPAFVEAARRRVPAGHFGVGDMEALPFPDEAFDVVCGFNSFQYAADGRAALREARRVLTGTGQLVIAIWGNPEDCEAATYLRAVGSLLPPPPPGAPGPFALSQNGLLETMLRDADLAVVRVADLPCPWHYPNAEEALRGLLSAGPAARAIEHSGWELTRATVAAALQPFVRPDGQVVYHNTYRVVVAQKASSN